MTDFEGCLSQELKQELKQNSGTPPNDRADCDNPTDEKISAEARYETVSPTATVSSSANSRNNNANADVPPHAGVHIERMEPGSILVMPGAVINQNYYGADWQREDKTRSLSLENLLCAGISLCLERVGYDIDAGDVKSSIKIFEAALTCSEEAYNWARKLLKASKPGRTSTAFNST